MPVRPILLLGHPDLYRRSSPVPEPVSDADYRSLLALIQDLSDTLEDFRACRGEGQAISAPQIGMRTRLVFCPQDPFGGAVINPVLALFGPTLEVWEGCLSFPGLYVRVRRQAGCEVSYRDLEWRQRTVTVSGEASIVMQHEYDHLEGVLSVDRAIDGLSFSMIPPWPRRPRKRVEAPSSI